MRPARALAVVTSLFLASCWSLTTDVPDVFGSARSQDGGSPADGGGSFCTPQATLCADFEHPSLTDGWNRLDLFSDGSASFADHPGNGKCFAAAAPAGKNGPAAQLVHEARGVPVDAKLSFEFRADALDTSGAVVVAEYVFVMNPDVVKPDYYSVQLWAQGKDFVIAETASSAPGKPPVRADGKLELGKWTSLELHVAFDKQTASLSVDGAVVADKGIILPSIDTAKMRMALGVSVGSTMTSAPTNVFFDNVVYDLTTR